MHQCGILMPIFSLNNEYGIGSFGKCAYEFVDFLTKTKQHFWQILPIGSTSYGDSPYQSFSSYAGNPYFIDIDILKEKRLLTIEDCESIKTKDEDRINYEKLYNTRFNILKKAYKVFLENVDEDYYVFIKENEWIYDYALFMSLKEDNNGKCFIEWDNKYKYYNKKILNDYYKENKEKVEFWYFVQYEFFNEWLKLKQYANKNEIKIIGDMPIYVALDSVDVWSNTQLFELDKDLKPINVAGCPPDYFSPLGQVWGNPLYNYKLMKKDNYKWWIERTKRGLSLFDYLRIDHFRGFESYFSIPSKDNNALRGKWVKGVGYPLFKKIKEELGKVNLIAEDLGYLTDSVKKLLHKCGFPGMKVLQFAFNPDGKSDYLLERHIKNCVVYSGTHDNPTIKDWYLNLGKEEKDFVNRYLNIENEEKIVYKMINKCLSSIAKIVIIPLADYLELGIDGRINTPSKVGDNWNYRINKNSINEELIEKIKNVTIINRRDK